MKRFIPMLPALLAATTISAHAESPHRADPTDPSQPGLSTVYQSAFDGYLPHQNGAKPSLEKWRAANDLVGSLGGHVGHIDASSSAHDHSNHQQPLPQSAPRSSPVTPPASEQGGHHHAH